MRVAWGENQREGVEESWREYWAGGRWYRREGELEGGSYHSDEQVWKDAVVGHYAQSVPYDSSLVLDTSGNGSREAPHRTTHCPIAMLMLNSFVVKQQNVWK